MELTKNNRIRLLNLIQHFIHLTPDDNPMMPEMLALRDLLTPQKVGRKTGWRKPTTGVLPHNKPVFDLKELTPIWEQEG